MKRLPGIREICLYFGGLDPIEEPIPIQPAQHYSMGGIDVNEKAASPVEGFYAAGECSCVSVHGANRLGGNSLLEAVVFGKIAGLSASEYVQESQGEDRAARLVNEAAAQLKERINQWLSKESRGNVYQLFHRLKKIMMEKVGIFREKGPLAEALEEIGELRHRYHQLALRSDCLQFCQELVTMMEFEYMLDIAEVITKGALAREETRGSHFRLDFPRRDDQNWLKHTIAEFTPKGPRLTYRPVKITRYQPQERKY